jgi:hypothetical protein
MTRRAGLALAAVVLILVPVLQGDVAAAHDPGYYFPIGTSYTRTPASHDVHTMDAGYP